jgi:FkbM family methyltransferase
MLTRLKNGLLRGGPESFALRQAFRLQAAAHGVSMRMTEERISLTHRKRRMILGKRDMISVPFVIHQWDLFFNTLEGKVEDGRTVLDFSVPGIHCYRKSGLSFYAPSIAEDDCMDAYLTSYQPKPGDVVWDVGAHAGMTAYFLAQMVGPAGKVYAFEPDETNYEFLLQNIQLHELSNVIPVKAALSDKTGTANFCMDGTMGAGLSDTLTYAAAENNREVETLSLPDACERFGAVPNYAKLDIEGAELNVVASSVDFLKEHPIHLSIESNHMVDGRYTSEPLEELLGRAGYRAWSSDSYGQLFTWGEPNAGVRSSEDDGWRDARREEAA